MKSSIVIIVIAFVFFGTFKNAISSDRPNIIFILTDDQHRKEFNFLIEGKSDDGSVKNLSPTIDQLVSEGIYFAQNHVVTAICTPSRYSILTGKYPSRAINTNFLKEKELSTQKNVTFNIGITEKDLTIAKLLKDGGYFTGAVGKNHVLKGKENSLGITSRNLPLKERLQQIQENNIVAYKECGFDYAANIYPGNLPGFLPNELLFHNTDWIINGALNFLELAEKKENPFFLYLATTVSHGPHKLGTKYKGDRSASAIGWLDKPVDIMPEIESIEKRIEDAGLEDEAKDVLWLDDAIKTVINKLEEIGEIDNTIIFFMTDHGVEYGKFTCYEGGTKAPLVLWGPSFFEGGRTIDSYISNIDYLPTIAELCKVDIPEDKIIDGKSIMPLVSNNEKDIHESLYHEIGATRAVLKDNWKYIAFRIPEYMEELSLKNRQKLAKKGVDPYSPYTHTCDRPGGRGGESPALGHFPFYFDSDQLYNLSDDPDEQVNLATNPKYKNRLRIMKKELKKYLDGLPGTFAEFK
jgi:arylsulfatase A-like enzyme